MFLMSFQWFITILNNAFIIKVLYDLKVKLPLLCDHSYVIPSD